MTKDEIEVYRQKRAKFGGELRAAINRCCMERGSDTPDFVLATYLIDCLAAYEKAVTITATWKHTEPLLKSALSKPSKSKKRKTAK